MLPPFIVVTVLTGLLGFMEDKRRMQVIHFFLLAITIQIHYAGFALIPLSLLMLFIWRKNLHSSVILGVVCRSLNRNTLLDRPLPCRSIISKFFSKPVQFER